jgi:glutamine---fructose-6-phosphate transaminase (isomerizing)
MPPGTGLIETHMLQEIREQPAVVRRALAEAEEPARRIASQVLAHRVDLVVLAARGTSDHATLYAQYLLQYLNGILVALATPSVFTVYHRSVRLDHALVIGISQSGEAPDVVEVLRRAAEAGALTVAVTNFADSPLARSAQEVLLCHAGREYSVAATKTYTTTCAVLAALAAALPGGEQLAPHLASVADQIQSALASEEYVARAATRYAHANECIVLGRGFQYSTAREAALKLAQTRYVTALSFSTADFRHGPAALIERGAPVMVYAPSGPMLADSLEVLSWLGEQGADCVVISEDERALQLATTPIRLGLSPVQDSNAWPNCWSRWRISCPASCSPIFSRSRRVWIRITLADCRKSLERTEGVAKVADEVCPCHACA